MDAFADLYGHLVSQPEPGGDTDDYVWIRYVPPSTQTNLEIPDTGIDLLEKPNVLSAAGSTGHRTWEAALHLASHISDATMHSYIRGKNVIELGAGTGLLSQILARLGASSVMATDGDRRTVSRLEASIQRNTTNVQRSADCTIITRQFTWGSDIAQLKQNGNLDDFDTVMAADVTYDISAVPDLIKSIRELVQSRKGACALVCSTVRNQKGNDTFLEICRKYHELRVELLSLLTRLQSTIACNARSSAAHCTDANTMISLGFSTRPWRRSRLWSCLLSSELHKIFEQLCRRGISIVYGRCRYNLKTSCTITNTYSRSQPDQASS